MKVPVTLIILPLLTLVTPHSQPILGIVTQVYKNKTLVINTLAVATMSFGARLIPLDSSLSDEQLKSEMQKINGVIFTGGNMDLCTPEGELTDWSVSVKRIFDFALQLNDQGIYYPIWGSCQGEQLMSILVAEDCSVLTNSHALQTVATVQYLPEAKNSRMLSTFDPQLLSLSEKYKFTFNNHGLGISAKTYYSYAKLNSFFTLLGTSFDSDGIKQAAIMEAKRYPIYMTLFHPEQTFLYFRLPTAFIRSVENIEYSQAFFRFFVEETRKNNNQMSHAEFQQKNLEKKPVTIINVGTKWIKNLIECYMY